jgi:formylglycine-generating enzyme required for sulfatase activity/regulation of enolase protein 1 (concanavalin A-like superfamily)
MPKRKLLRTSTILLGIVVVTSPVWWYVGFYLGGIGLILPGEGIVGTVTDMDTGKPLAGCYVGLGFYEARLWGPVRVTRTAGDGSYRFRGLGAPARERIMARATAFDDYKHPVAWETDIVEARVIPLRKTRVGFRVDRTPPELEAAKMIRSDASQRSLAVRVEAADNLAVARVDLYHGGDPGTAIWQNIGAEFTDGRGDETGDGLARLGSIDGEERDGLPYDALDEVLPWHARAGRRWGWLQVFARPGTGFTATTDDGHLIYERVVGDFNAVTCLSARPWKAGQESGLMVRQGANHWAKLTYRRSGWHRQVICARKADRTVSILAAARCSADPLWLCMRRTRNRFTASVSTDGSKWRQLHQWSEPLPERTLVGLMVAAGPTKTYQTDFDFLRFRKITVICERNLGPSAKPEPSQFRLDVGDASGNTVPRGIPLGEIGNNVSAGPGLRTQVNPVDGAEMVWLPGGTFLMGAEPEAGAAPDLVPPEYERPAHEQRLTGFWMYRTEVTNAQYRKFIKGHSGWSREGVDHGLADDGYLTHWARPMTEFPDGDSYPAVFISWHAARAYAKWAGGDLPTEAEWEYAARGGKQLKSGSETEVNEQGTRPVASYAPNPFGLYDMAGNVWEWCSSLFKPYPYDPSDGREDPDTPGHRMLRGGSFYISTTGWDYQRAADRSHHEPPSDCSGVYGFRLVVRQELPPASSARGKRIHPLSRSVDPTWTRPKTNPIIELGKKFPNPKYQMKVWLDLWKRDYFVVQGCSDSGLLNSHPGFHGKQHASFRRPGDPPEPDCFTPAYSFDVIVYCGRIDSIWLQGEALNVYVRKADRGAEVVSIRYTDVNPKQDLATQQGRKLYWIQFLSTDGRLLHREGRGL